MLPAPTLYAVFFKDNKRGWATGIGGILICTQDGGANWKKITSNSTYSIYSIQLSRDLGWAVGSEGNYITTADGGKTWTKQEEAIASRFWFHGVSFRGDDKEGYAVGARGTVFQSKDGGNTWTILSGLTYKMPEIKLPF